MIFECVDYRARFQPETAAIETPQGPISYARFAADISRMTGTLGPLITKPHSLVLISDSRPYIHWLLVFALERLGHISVSDDAAGVTAELLQPDIILSESTGKAGHAGKIVEVSAQWLKTALSSPAATLPAPTRAPDDTVRMILSSGTTGVPKPIELKREQLDRRAMHAATLFPSMSGSMLSTMGMNTVGGYAAAFSVFMSGGKMLYGGALGTGAAVSALRPTFMLLAPIQLQYLLAGLSEDFQPLTDLQIVLTGSPTPRRLFEQAAKRLTENIVFGYGSTEAGFVSVGAAHLVDETPGAAGWKMPWAQLEIVDDNREPVVAGTIGNVRTRTDEMAAQYRGGDNPPGHSGFRDGWFYPGDTGHMDERGLFVLHGRADDVFNLGGVKIAAWTIEEQLLRDPRISEAGAFVEESGDLPELCAAIVSDTPISDLQKDHQHVGKRPVHLVAASSIPRNQMGKILRSEIPAQTMS